MANSDQVSSEVTYDPMPEEEGIRAFIAKCDGFYPPDAVAASIDQQRSWYDALCAEFAFPHPAGMQVEDDVIADVPVRHYRPAECVSNHKIVYMHGGGFVVGSRDSHDAICAEISQAAKAELIAIDYRLAPEHIWPAQHEDCHKVTQSLLASGKKVVLVGDSAGGMLAAGIAVRAREEGFGDRVLGQALIYPALGGDLNWPSYGQMASAPGLSTDDVIYYRDVLKAPMDDPFAHALSVDDLRGLPPTFITAAYFDPLRDDGREYTARLARAGISVQYREEPQMIHGWLRARHMSPGAKTAFGHLCDAITAMVGPE
ncbi:alpha/beta hydrolase [Thalassospira sp.]|uniref:alpha/beta hydrolase n=1 Tax=Thalassospira sp. TaxID=1912094 RepID=UPI000C4618CE|nr:alpha/beta hydrolase [Thalassospira sp.]MBC07495.1 carboxylesterase [Thalassospira sp.]|tara:strand:- start:4589 stop:5533 length:945 start_codon:yes stop_codon:yes gene_type:complete